MSIRNKLIVSFVVIMLFVLFMGITLISLNSSYQRLTNKVFSEYSRLYFWKDINQRFTTGILDLKPASGIRAKALTKLIKNIDNGINFDEKMNDKIEVTAGKLERLHGLSKQAAGKTAELSELALSIGDDLQYFINYYSSEIDAASGKMAVIGRQGIMISILITLFTLVSGAAMVLILFRSIVHPITVLQQSTKHIGDGNLDHRIDLNTKDEIGQLAESFNQMVNNLKGLQLQVVQMDRMSSIGQLAGGVAHEINNPLTGVLGQTQLLLEKLPADSPYRYTVERIEGAAQRCRRIVRALLDFAREKNYKFQPTNIAELIEETLTFTRSEMNSKKIIIDQEIPDPVPDITASAGHLQQVFLNIINNSIHAMPKGGKLLIAVNISEKNVMDISFTDTGIGIKKENLNHVFDPFFTTKDVGKGTGLGLTISYGIIKRHNGDMFVKSPGENMGATFTVRIPIDIHKADKLNDQAEMIKGFAVKDEEINLPPTHDTVEG